MVAGEVRSLAQRSGTAAKEIKSLIDVSTQQVGAGVDTIGRAGRSLDQIVTRVLDISNLVVAISAATREQSSALQQVNNTVTEMDQTTQQNTAMVEESTAASHALAKDADRLAKLMERFNVGTHGEAVDELFDEALPEAAAAA